MILGSSLRIENKNLMPDNESDNDSGCDEIQESVLCKKSLCRLCRSCSSRSTYTASSYNLKLHVQVQINDTVCVKVLISCSIGLIHFNDILNNDFCIENQWVWRYEPLRNKNLSIYLYFSAAIRHRYEKTNNYLNTIQLRSHHTSI